MEVHAGEPGKPSKSEIEFFAAPPLTYDDPDSFDGQDLSDVDCGNGTCPIVDEFKYLGSIISRDCKDSSDIDERIKKAGAAFGALKKCLFTNHHISPEAKRAVYVGLVIAILLYGSECWCLTEVLFDRLRTFHGRCVRSMKRVSRKHSRQHRISDENLRRQLG